MNNKEEEIILQYYNKYKVYMKDHYNWSQNLGEFECMFSWIVKSGMLQDLSIVGVSNGRRTIKKVANKIS
jgi:hypothetical protein